MTLISRFTHPTYWRLLVMAALLAMDVAAPTRAATDPVEVHELLGLKVNASVTATDPSIVHAPSSSDTGWQTLRQPLGQGFGEQVYCVRIALEVPQPLLNAPMVLRFHPPNARDVKFFLPKGEAIDLGTKASFEQRTLGFADLAASFVPTASPTVIDVRLVTAGKLFGTFELMSERAYYQSQAWRTATHGVFFGMLLLALIVNCLIWVTARQGIYGLYVGFVGFSLLASLAANGYLHTFVLGAWTAHLSTIQLWAFAGMAVTAIGFAARILHLRAWRVWLERAADGLGAVLVVLALLASFWTSLSLFVWEFVWVALMVYGTISLPASVRQLRQSRSLQDGLLVLAFLLFALTQWVSMGTVFGLVPATPVNVGMWQIGLVIHLVLLQMALTINSKNNRRIDWLQRTRIEGLKLQADTENRHSRDLQLFLSSSRTNLKRHW